MDVFESGKCHFLFGLMQTTMQVMFFATDGLLQPLFDRRPVIFTPTAENPAPPQAFIREHFKQAVLANMRGAGQIPKLDYDESEDAQSMSTFESGDGKQWFETHLAGKLVPGLDDTDPARYNSSTVLQ